MAQNPTPPCRKKSVFRGRFGSLCGVATQIVPMSKRLFCLTYLKMYDFRHKNDNFMYSILLIFN